MSDVKFTVDQQAPAADGAVSTPATGSWTGATYSFKVMARYNSDATDVDNFGVDRDTVGVWNEIIVAGSDSVVIPVTLDTKRDFTFQVIRQTAAAYVEGNAGALINDAELSFTQTSATIYTITLDSGASSANLTIGDNANTLEFSAPATPEVVYRNPSGRAYQGQLIRRDFIDSDRIIDQISILADSFLSITVTGQATLQRWLKNHVYTKLTFPSGASSFFTDVHGFIQSLSYYDTRTDKDKHQIIFDVDAESNS